MIYNLLHFFAIYSPSWRAKRAFFLHSTFGSKFIHFIILKIKTIPSRGFYLRNEYCCISISFQKFKDFSKKIIYLSILQVEEVFWQVTDEIRGARLKRYVVPCEEQTEFESKRLWKNVSEAIGLFN